MTHPTDPFAHAQNTAHAWLNVIADRLGTQDRHYTYRVLRAWLHLVRDRLTVDSAVHLGAQLPELLRGIYFEGWAPSRVPARYDATWFTNLFASEANISPADVPAVAGKVSAGLNALFSPGQLDHVFAVMPAALRGELEGHTPAEVPAPRHTTEQPRLTALENTVQALAEAVTTLARGLEELPANEPSGDRPAKAAQEAHRILMARGTVGT